MCERGSAQSVDVDLDEIRDSPYGIWVVVRRVVVKAGEKTRVYFRDLAQELLAGVAKHDDTADCEIVDDVDGVS